MSVGTKGLNPAHLNFSGTGVKQVGFGVHLGYIDLQEPKTEIFVGLTHAFMHSRQLNRVLCPLLHIGLFG